MKRKLSPQSGESTAKPGERPKIAFSALRGREAIHTTSQSNHTTPH